jgi:hypothetical protein
VVPGDPDREPTGRQLAKHRIYDHGTWGTPFTLEVNTGSGKNAVLHPWARDPSTLQKKIFSPPFEDGRNDQTREEKRREEKRR